MNWTQEAVRAEQEYRRERLHRLARRDLWADGLPPVDRVAPARTGRLHRFLHRGGRPAAVETTG